MINMTSKNIIKMSNENWVPAISDGLTLPCGICNRVPPFDYKVDDELWELVVGDHPHKRGVICLPCLDKLAVDKGYDISTHLEFVQFTGIGKTIELLPSRLFQYEPKKPKDFKDRQEQLNEKVLRLKIRTEEMLKGMKTLEELRLEGEELDKKQRDRIRHILKDSPYMLHYYETGEKLY